MKKITLNIIFAILPAILLFGIALADGKKQPEINIQANYNVVKYENKDIRISTLESFFEKYNSPLKNHAKTFVETADLYNMDYKLLPAISCMESTCAKKIIPNSYNPFGWGIYGNNYIAFDSYDHAIKTVADGIFKGYISKGLDTVEKMAPVYTPPNYNHWMSGVNYFIYDIKEFERIQEIEELKSKVLHYL
mgnify:CR=1 FL=1